MVWPGRRLPAALSPRARLSVPDCSWPGGGHLSPGHAAGAWVGLPPLIKLGLLSCLLLRGVSHPEL